VTEKRCGPGGPPHVASSGSAPEGASPTENALAVPERLRKVAFEGERRDVVAYVRVSSGGQDVATQRHALEQAARARGETIARWFIEKASARTLERPELTALRAAVRLGQVRRLFVFQLDRLTRSGMRDTLALLEELRGAGCRVSTLSDGFDLDGPAADVVVAVLAWVAQMELRTLRERVAAARARVEASGGRWGRARRVDDLTAARVCKLKKEGRSVRAIARDLKIPRSVVGRVLSQKGAYAAPPKGSAESGA
jgi:DNA invertase Pin-like site-specific DNA recombinase